MRMPAHVAKPAQQTIRRNTRPSRHAKFLLSFLITCFVTLVLPSITAASQRVALVIGNASYSNVEALDNPLNDARDLTGALETFGFEVTSATDLRRSEMYETLRNFRRKADQAEIALVYYAGHGIEIGGTNYLVPVDARLEDVRDAPVEMVQVEDVLSQLSGARGLRMIVLDACRNNPFETLIASNGATRSVGRGLVRVDTAQAGTMIVYAAAEGQVVPDGYPGENSPFTSAFLAALSQPPMDVRLLMGKVRDEMATRAPGVEPYVYQSLGGREFVLNASLQTPEPEPAPPARASSEPQNSVDFEAMQRDFDLARRLNTLLAWEAFLQLHSDGSDSLMYRMAKLARDKLADEAEQRSARPVQPDNAEEGLASLSDTDSGATEINSEQPEARTEDAANELTAARTPELTPPPPPIDPEQAARELQRLLQRRNCYVGAIDGILGPQSRAAFARFADAAGSTMQLPRGADGTTIQARVVFLEERTGIRCQRIAAPARTEAPRRRTAPVATQPNVQQPQAVERQPEKRRLPADCYLYSERTRKNYSFCQ